MIRKIFSVITAISLIALLAMGEAQRSSAAAQTITPNLTLNITDLELLGVNSLIVSWTVKKTGSVTIQPYEITLELSRNGVTERFFKTAASTATFVNFDLRGISADRRAKLFGPNLKATAVVKATFYRHQTNGTFKSILEVNKTKIFSAVDAGPIAK
ncbi:MAG: hypothetical protein ACREBD_31400 [Blastocatellia bacterium]